MSPQPFDHLRSGDISKTSPANTPAEVLVRSMVWEAVRLQVTAGDALGAACGFVTWTLSHFQNPVDRESALSAFLQSTEVAARGSISGPLSKFVTFDDPLKR